MNYLTNDYIKYQTLGSIISAKKIQEFWFNFLFSGNSYIFSNFDPVRMSGIFSEICPTSWAQKYGSSLNKWFFLYSVLFSVQWNLFLKIQLFSFLLWWRHSYSKELPYENESKLSVGGGLFHWRALLNFYTA